MKRAAVFIEQGNNRPNHGDFGMISYLRQLGCQLYAFVLNQTSTGWEKKLADYGLNRVVTLSFGGAPRPKTPELKAQAVARAMETMGIPILFALATLPGKELLARVAAELEAPLLMDCTAVDLKAKTATTSLYSGKTQAVIQVEGNHLVFGIRPHCHKPIKQPLALETEQLRLPPLPGGRMELVASQAGILPHMDLNEAEVILSGGRGLENGDNFDILRQCAKELNAGVGASRVAVDKGWVPYAMQIGQTGLKVSPVVYIACGISGSVQHFAGMKTAKIIIAVNKDPDAAIVKKSDYFTTNDLFEVIPLLTQALKTFRKNRE
ncbi:MAG TPA: electron transfer flavoprotein subunit alpha/FixB family protein [Desulfobacteraceae bacterium]|nr:electron transfer flavoprotein subunit alpha/FixB family protein [Desulfobacteraceae bacterium]